MSEFDFEAPTSRLRVNGYGEVYARDARRFLSAVERAYNGLYVIDALTASGEPGIRGWPFPVVGPGIDDAIESAVPSVDALVLASVQLESPGFWEFLGALNPLQQIREYLNDRHERKKDKAYRNAAEKRRLDAEAEAAELKNVREKIAILGDLGVPPTVIAEQLVLDPLRELGRVQDENVVTTADLADGGHGTKRVRKPRPRKPPPRR
jgi:hypothetical protein